MKMSAGVQLENANPVIFQRSGERLPTASEEDGDVHDPIDAREIFDILLHHISTLLDMILTNLNNFKLIFLLSIEALTGNVKKKKNQNFRLV